MSKIGAYRARDLYICLSEKKLKCSIQRPRVSYSLSICSDCIWKMLQRIEIHSYKLKPLTLAVSRRERSIPPHQNEWNLIRKLEWISIISTLLYCFTSSALAFHANDKKNNGKTVEPTIESSVTHTKMIHNSHVYSVFTGYTRPYSAHCLVQSIFV